jgi:hypothetical protein
VAGDRLGPTRIAFGDVDGDGDVVVGALGRRGAAGRIDVEPGTTRIVIRSVLRVASPELGQVLAAGADRVIDGFEDYLVTVVSMSSPLSAALVRGVLQARSGRDVSVLVRSP